MITTLFNEGQSGVQISCLSKIYLTLRKQRRDLVGIGVGEVIVISLARNLFEKVENN